MTKLFVYLLLSFTAVILPHETECWLSLARPLLKPVIEEAGQFIINSITMALMAEEITDTEKEQEIRNTYKERKQEQLERSKHGAIDPILPKDPFHHPDWEDISHPQAEKEGHHKFRNKQTGEVVDFDKGTPGAPGHEGRDHFHRPNPHSTNGKKDSRLDKDKNPIHKNSDEAHLYPEE